MASNIEKEMARVLQHFGLVRDKLRVEITNSKVFVTLARRMNDWEKIYFGEKLTEAILGEIKKDNIMDEDGRRRTVLTRWKQLYGHEATYEQLLLRYVESGRMDLADLLCEEYIKQGKPDTSHIANTGTGTSTTATTYTEPLDIDKDGPTVKELLKPLNNDELKGLFETLGLYDATLRNKKYSHSTAVYLDDLVRGWIQGRDAVLDRGGATWESLKRALQRLDHNGIAAKITPSTADQFPTQFPDSSSITRRSMREDKSHGSSQSPDQSLQLTTSNTQLMTQDESHNVRLRVKEQPSSSHNQNDEEVVQTNTPQQQDLRWFLVKVVMIIMLFMLLVVMIGYYVYFFRES